MKTIETQIFVQDPENKNKVQYKGQRKAKDVFAEIEAALIEANCCPEEYFTLHFDLWEKDFPEMQDLCCYAEWGANEGIYIDIKVLTKVEDDYKWIRLATGKTLDETKDAFIRMQYIAGYIYLLLMGEQAVHPRYMIIPTGEPKQNQIVFRERLREEFFESLIKELFHKGTEDLSQESAGEIALKAMLLKVMSESRFSKEKLEELLSMDNILDGVSHLCQHILSPSYYEIEDALMSCSTFRECGVTKGLIDSEQI